MSKNLAMFWIIFYLILFLLGSFLAYSAFTQYQKTQNLLHKGIKTTATVAKFYTHQSDGSTMYKPVFEFIDRSQTERTFESSISSSPPAYKIGDKVKIIYDAASPEKAKTISFWGLYHWSIILLMVASPLLVIGGSYLLYITK